MALDYTNWITNVNIPEGDARSSWTVYRNDKDGFYYALKLSPYPHNSSFTESHLHDQGGTNYGHSGLWEIMDLFYPDEDFTADDVFRDNYVEWGHSEALTKMSYEWYRPLVPNSKYLFCLRVSSDFMRNVMLAPVAEENPIDQAAAQSIPSEPEAPSEPEGISEAEKVIKEEIKSAKTQQRKDSEKEGVVRFTLKMSEASDKITKAISVLGTYKKAISKSKVKAEDIGGLDLSAEIRRLKTSEKKIKKLLGKNKIKFNSDSWSANDIIEFTFDKNFSMLHFTFNGGAGLAGATYTEKEPEPQDGDTTTEGIRLPHPIIHNQFATNQSTDINNIFYDGFGRRDLTEVNHYVFLPSDMTDEDEKDYFRSTEVNVKAVRKATTIRRRKKNVFSEWNTRTFSLLASLDKLNSQFANLPDGTDPWTEFLPKCVFPNPCAFPEKIEAAKHTATQATAHPSDPSGLTPYTPNAATKDLDKKSMKTATEIQQQKAATPDPMREKLSEVRMKATNVVSDAILGCDSELTEMISDITDLYSLVLDRIPLSEIMGAAINDVKSDMKAQVAQIAGDIEGSVTAEVNKIMSEVECATDLLGKELQARVNNVIPGLVKDSPTIEGLVSEFEVNNLTFEFPQIEISSILSFIQDAVEEVIMELVESALTYLISEATESLCKLAQGVSLDGLSDKLQLDNPLLKAAFGAVPLSSLINAEAIADIAESAGLDPTAILEINDTISDAFNPQEMIALLAGEASEGIRSRLFGLVDGMTSLDLAAYLESVGNRIPPTVMDEAFESPVATICLDEDYLEAAEIVKNLFTMSDAARKKQANSGLQRNKEKVKSICDAMSGAAAKKIEDKVKSLPMPSKAKDLMKEMSSAADTIMIKMMAAPIEAFVDSYPQSNENFRWYLSTRNNAEVQMYLSDDGFYRLGKWALGATADENGVSYSISERGALSESARIKLSRILRARVKVSINDRVLNVDERETINGILTGVYATSPHYVAWSGAENKVAKNIEELHANMRQIYTSSTYKEKRARFANLEMNSSSDDCLGLAGTADLCLQAIERNSVPPSLTGDEKKTSEKQILKAVYLSFYARILPFLTSMITSVEKAHGDHTFLWHTNDEVTNKLVTEYVYALLFGQHNDPRLGLSFGSSAWYAISQSGAQYGDLDGGPLEVTRRRNFKECGFHNTDGTQSIIAEKFIEQSAELYTILTSDEKIKGYITPSESPMFGELDEDSDEDSDEMLPATIKSLISLTLNLAATYNEDKRIGPEGAEAQMMSVVNTNVNRNHYEAMGTLAAFDRLIEDPGLFNKIIPAQALAALFVIHNFHDNNGWRQSTYLSAGTSRNLADINYRGFRSNADRLLIEQIKNGVTE